MALGNADASSTSSLDRLAQTALGEHRVRWLETPSQKTVFVFGLFDSWRRLMPESLQAFHDKQ